ncbi:MAG: TIR domain-containing protein [Bacteroidaceae bacterium]|nr:TIR domain-containing protein [Bacteroidaceae bacterium]
MKYDVFISYSRKDSAIVKRFADELHKAGYRCWLDVDGVETGDEFKSKIVTAIKESELFLFFSSQASNRSPWTVKEVNVAVSLKKTIIPIKLDANVYNDSLLFDLAGLDFIRCEGSNDVDEAIAKLIRSLGKKIVADKKDEIDIYKKEEGAAKPSNNFWNYFASSTFKVSFRYFVVLLIVVSVGVGAWSSFIVQTSKQPDTEREQQSLERERLKQASSQREQYVKDSLMTEFERKEKARIAEQHRLEKEPLAKENAEKVRIAEQQSLERERLKQASSQREQYVKDSLMAEFERKEKARIAEQQRLEKERLAKENAEKVRIAEQQSLERERLKQASSQREQYMKDSLMAEFERKEKARIAEQQRLEKERLAKEAAERERLEKILSTPRSSKGLLCVAAVNKNSHEIAYFTAEEWESLPQDVKTNYAQLGVSISKDSHEFIIAPMDCKDPDDGDYELRFGCYGMEFDRVIQYKKISEFITTGYNDTKNIVEQAKGKIDSLGIKGAPAAEAAWNYKTNEYDNLQWYLPSVSELEMIYRNKDAINEFIIRYISQGEGVLDKFYWSSTVYDYDFYWYVYMSNGYSLYYNLRTYSLRVRAVALAK